MARVPIATRIEPYQAAEIGRRADLAKVTPSDYLRQIVQQYLTSTPLDDMTFITRAEARRVVQALKEQGVKARPVGGPGHWRVV